MPSLADSPGRLEYRFCVAKFFPCTHRPIKNCQKTRLYVIKKERSNSYISFQSISRHRQAIFEASSVVHRQTKPFRPQCVRHIALPASLTTTIVNFDDVLEKLGAKGGSSSLLIRTADLSNQALDLCLSQRTDWLL